MKDILDFMGTNKFGQVLLDEDGLTFFSPEGEPFSRQEFGGQVYKQWVDLEKACEGLPYFKLQFWEVE